MLMAALFAVSLCFLQTEHFGPLINKLLKRSICCYQRLTITRQIEKVINEQLLENVIEYTSLLKIIILSLQRSVSRVQLFK